MKVAVLWLLKVDVVLLIENVCKRIGIPVPSTTELSQIVSNNDRVWDMYKQGFTVCVNQCESEGTIRKLKKYQPKNISELCAFIAAIRPAFKSMYSKFESREPFSYNIRALDKLLQTEELPMSYVLYQEQTMAILNFAGFPMDQCYGIIKAIAKKHPEKVKPLKATFIDGFAKRIIEEEPDIAEKEALDKAQEVWQIINDSCSYGFNCLSGSTIITRGARNHHNPLTIEEMYLVMNDKEYAKTTKHESLYDKYNHYGYGKSLSMYEDKKIRPNDIITIKQSGIQQTYKLTTKSGAYIICTANHKFPTPSGLKKLKDLIVGEPLYHMGTYKKKYFDTSLGSNEESNLPKKGEQGFQKLEHSFAGTFYAFINSKKEAESPCELCNKPFDQNKRFEAHHKDFDRRNTTTENLQWLCCSCHKKIHYQNNRNKRYDNGIDVYLDEIVSIEPYKMEMTYDIAMEDPAHNFVVSTGIVTANSSHAYCMALDSLYCAYLKSHYPYEFYEVLLQMYSDKGKKDKVQLLKNEMKLAFGISEGQYKFGLDNRKFVVDKDNCQILPSLLSIKGFGQKTADELYAVSKQIKEGATFYDVWKVLKDAKEIKKSHIENLIYMDYFSAYGTMGKIFKFLEHVDVLYGRSQFSRKDVNEKYRSIIEKHSGSVTEKQYRKFDFDAALTELWETSESDRTDIGELVQKQYELFGYALYKNEKCDHTYGVVLDIDTKYSPKLTLHMLDNGEQEVYKMKKTMFNNRSVGVGQLIKFVYETKPRVRKENGQWIELNETEKWITNFIRKDSKKA